MKALRLTVLFVCVLGQGQTWADGPLPYPRTLEEDYGQFSVSDFGRLLQQLKAEREALRTDWQALVKKNARPAVQISDDDLLQFKQILQHLQKRNSSTLQPPAPATEQPRTHDLEKTTGEPPPPVKQENPVATDAPAVPSSPVLSLSAQANALFRSRQFEDALTTFRLIELKGQKAEVRAPVQYLMALCLIHLGKTEEAQPLLREVANSRGDDKLAGYAQWHLEMLRWQKDIQDRLQDIRQRRQAVEKRS